MGEGDYILRLTESYWAPPKILLLGILRLSGRKKVLRGHYVQCRREMKRFEGFFSHTHKPQPHSTSVCNMESNNLLLVRKSKSRRCAGPEADSRSSQRLLALSK